MSGRCDGLRCEPGKAERAPARSRHRSNTRTVQQAFESTILAISPNQSNFAKSSFLNSPPIVKRVDAGSQSSHVDKGRGGIVDSSLSGSVGNNSSRGIVPDPIDALPSLKPRATISGDGASDLGPSSRWRRY